MKLAFTNSKTELKYAMYRIPIGALLGFSATSIIGYILACYNNDLSFKIAIYIFRYPNLGLSLLLVSFIGAVIGAIASLFSKKWNQGKL
jgi:hypothetical protein